MVIAIIDEVALEPEHVTIHWYHVSTICEVVKLGVVPAGMFVHGPVALGADCHW